jgi:hypothetical protein
MNMIKKVNSTVRFLQLVLSIVLLTNSSLFAQTNTFPSTGNVGIGTTVPYAWFPGLVTELRDHRPILRLSPLSDGELGTILFKGAYNNSNETADEMHLNYVSSSSNPKIRLSSYIGGYKTIVSFSGNGNVGIGVEDAGEKLAVNGLIRSKEVKVETINWPDYVFKPNYQLLTFAEIKAFIASNNHLPDLPSAEQVSKEGIRLGEMNAALLKKIEELTLHLIEKDDQLHTERHRNDLQQKELNAHKAELILQRKMLNKLLKAR